MRASKTRRKTSSVASAVGHLAPSCSNQMLPISSSCFDFCEPKFVQHGSITIAIDLTASPCSFSNKNDPIIPLDQNPHQIVTRFGCVGFSMRGCGFSVPQTRQYCLFTYPPRSKWASSEKMIFFLSKSASSVSRSVAIFPSVVHAYTQPYTFGGRIKLIICQIRHELSVTIHEISTSWKKMLEGGPNIFFILVLMLLLVYL